MRGKSDPAETALRETAYAEAGFQTESDPGFPYRRRSLPIGWTYPFTYPPCRPACRKCAGTYLRCAASFH